MRKDTLYIYITLTGERAEKAEAYKKKSGLSWAKILMAGIEGKEPNPFE
jgi:hypothetical protein